MQNAVRTTIRIQKDLLDQSKRVALERGTTLQNVINETLARGFGEISDFNRHEKAMARIDALRKKLSGKKINVQALIDENKRELEKRTNRLLKNPRE